MTSHVIQRIHHVWKSAEIGQMIVESIPASHVFFPPFIPDPRSHFPTSKCTHLNMLAWYMSLSRDIMVVLTYKRFCAIDPVLFLKFLNSILCFKEISLMLYVHLIHCFIHGISKYSPPLFQLAIPYWWIPHYHKQCCSGHPMHLPFQICVSIYPDCVSRSGTAGSKVTHIWNVVHFCHIALHNGCSIYTSTSPA